MSRSIFGLPIVLNPTMLIPFMLVPTLNIIISYFAMALGFVPICSGVNFRGPVRLESPAFLLPTGSGRYCAADPAPDHGCCDLYAIYQNYG